MSFFIIYPFPGEIVKIDLIRFLVYHMLPVVLDAPPEFESSLGNMCECFCCYLGRSETPVILEANQSWQPEIENIH
jgi:hypothetical protein